MAWTGVLAVLRALRERKIRVPDDVSVITFASELPLCDFTAPALAAMEMDVARYTSVAAQVRPALEIREVSAPERRLRVISR